MLKKDTKILEYNKDNINLICKELTKGEVIAIPTETVYGLSANACDELAVSKIYHAKGRPSFNPLIVHFHSMDHIKEYVQVNEWAIKIIENLCPAPITMILKRKENTKLSHLVSAGLDTVGVRIPDHPIALEIIKQTNLPLSAPSANSSGLVSPTTAEHVLKSLGGRIPYIMNGGNSHVGVESTVIDLSADIPTILRYGYITQSTLEDILGTPVNTVNINDDNSPKSPGMMTSHYAPSLPVFKDVLHPKDKQAYIGFGIPHDNEQNIYTDNLSTSGDLVEACANLFKFLHKYDDSNSYTAIAFAPIPNTGLGLAINDRLNRATIR